MATVRGLKYLPGVLGACLMAMMQVGPSEAEINFCKWLQLAHPGAEEKCLSIPHLEPIVWTVAAGLCAATLLLLFFANHPGAKLALAGVGSRAEAFYDYIQRRGWRPIIREVRLDLHWRNQKLLLEIESLYLDRQYDVHIDLTQADVPIRIGRAIRPCGSAAKRRNNAAFRGASAIGSKSMNGKRQTALTVFIGIFISGITSAVRANGPVPTFLYGD